MEEKIDLPVSKHVANELYEKAGALISEDQEEITIEKYNYLLKDSVHLIIQEVLVKNSSSLSVAGLSVVDITLSRITKECDSCLAYWHRQDDLLIFGDFGSTESVGCSQGGWPSDPAVEASIH